MLELTLDVVNEAARGVRGSSVMFTVALVYIGAILLATTDEVLLRETGLALPQLGLEQPVKGFYTIAPILFLALHLYMLNQFRSLAEKCHAFNLELVRALPNEDDHVRWRALVSGFPLAQIWLGPSRADLFLPKMFVWVLGVFAPVAMLMLIQLRFLPYQSDWITGIHQAAVLIDLVVLWAVWGRCLDEAHGGGGMERLAVLKVGAVTGASAAVVGFTLMIAIPYKGTIEILLSGLGSNGTDEFKRAWRTLQLRHKLLVKREPGDAVTAAYLRDVDLFL